MEFLLYLNADTKDIYNIISRKIKIVENAPICRKHKIFGWYDSKQKFLTVCTDKINTYSNSEYYINETILHEAVHVAQSCKSGDGYLEPFGISKSAMPITERRRNDVRTAVSIAGESIKNIEHEAFWMEDKPEKVKYVLEKYCF